MSLQGDVRRLQDEREDLKLALDEANSVKSSTDAVLHELRSQLKQLNSQKRSQEDSVALIEPLRNKITALQKAFILEVKKHIRDTSESKSSNVIEGGGNQSVPVEELQSILKSDKIQEKLSQGELECVSQLLLGKQERVSDRADRNDTSINALLKLLIELEPSEQALFSGLISNALQTP